MKFTRKILLFLTAPVRYAFRHEFKRAMSHGTFGLNHTNALTYDLFVASEQIAYEDSGRYVADHLYNAKVFTSSEQVWEHAIDVANLNSEDVVLEFGVASGNSVNYIAKRVPCLVYGYDSYDGLPEDWRSGFDAGCFKMGKMPDVRENVILVKGLFSDTLPKVKEQFTQIKLLHVDCDLYSSTVEIFDMLAVLLRPGCVIIFDEYLGFPGWQQCEFLAFKEFIEKSGRSYEYLCYNSKHEQVAVRLLS